MAAILVVDHCSCTSGSQIPSAEGTPSGTHVLILGIRSSRGLQTVADYLNAGHVVSFLTFSKIPRDFLSKVPVLESPVTRGNFKVIYGPGKCRPEFFESLFSKRAIGQVHVIFDPDDFPPFAEPTELGAIMKCYVGLLQGISAYRDVPIYVHIQLGGDLPHVPQYMQPEVPVNVFGWGEARSRRHYSRPPVAFDSNKCELDFDYKALYDVFVKQIELYSRTFRNLHNLNITFILSCMSIWW